MPFIPQSERVKPLNYEIPGHRTYEEYRKMITAWGLAPRWATIDAIASYIWKDRWHRAMVLAFLVFFIRHAAKYEDQKCKENGDII